MFNHRFLNTLTRNIAVLLYASTKPMDLLRIATSMGSEQNYGFASLWKDIILLDSRPFQIYCG